MGVSAHLGKMVEERVDIALPLGPVWSKGSILFKTSDLHNDPIEQVVYIISDS